MRQPWEKLDGCGYQGCQVRMSGGGSGMLKSLFCLVEAAYLSPNVIPLYCMKNPFRKTRK